MKITRRQLRRIIKEELRLLEVDSDGDGTSDKEELLKIAANMDNMDNMDDMKLESLVRDEFQVWQEEQANLKSPQPGLGSGGSGGIRERQRSEVYDKVKRTLIQDYGFIDGMAAYKLKTAGEQYDADTVVDIGKPIYKKIYDILYVLIPRPRRY